MAILKRKKVCSTPEKLREYQARYYRTHIEKSKEYQRQYNITHRRAWRRDTKYKCNPDWIRQPIRDTYTTRDIQQTDAVKLEKVFNSIIRGERDITV